MWVLFQHLGKDVEIRDKKEFRIATAIISFEADA
jgi:hypothetical protein